MRWYHWIWIPFVIVASVIAYYLGRRRGTLKEVIELELDVVDARAEANTELARLGAENARQWVEESYAHTLERLGQEQRDEADKLRDDPAALAEYLTRAGYGA